MFNEAFIRENAEKFCDMFKHHSSVMLLIDSIDDRIIDVNQSGVGFYGYSRAEMTDMKMQDISQKIPEQLNIPTHSIQEDGHSPSTCLHRISGGEVKSVEVVSTPITIDGKEWRLSIINDISNRVLAEKALLEGEEMFKALFEQAIGYTMILQPTSNGIPTIIDVNKSACEAHGYTRDQMLGRPVTDLDDEKGKRLCMERTKHIMTGEEFNIETNHVRKDGSTFPVEVHATLVHLTDKPPIILTTEYDITERKNIESDLQKAKSALEKLNKDHEEVNIALNVMIKKLEKNKIEVEKTILFNVEELLLPVLGKLKNNLTDEKQKLYLEIFELNLNQIVSPFGQKVANHFSKLTPAQIQVANLIKQGMTTKEIAALLNLSPFTIAAQRREIRKRLALAPKTSLRTALLTTEET